MQINDAVRLAHDLMTEHGLYRWSFRWTRSRTVFGACEHSTKTILLSSLLTAARSEEETRLTLLHEIAHALTPGHNHDRVWRRKCLSIGGDGQRVNPLPSGFREQTARYEGTCPACGAKFYRDRFTRGTDRMYHVPHKGQMIEWFDRKLGQYVSASLDTLRMIG